MVIIDPDQLILPLIHLPHFFTVELVAFVLEHLQTHALVDIQGLLQEPASAALGALEELLALLVGRGAHARQLLLFLLLRTARAGLVQVGGEVRGLVLRVLPDRGVELRLLVDGALVV